MKTLLCGFAVLLCLASFTSAQEAPKPQAQPPFKARLLFLKADWSKAEAAKEIDADLRTALKDAAIPKEAFDQLPRTGPGILFARGMLSVYRAEPFAQVAAWLKQRGLIESELAFEAAPRDPTVRQGVRDHGSASAFQDFDLSDLQRLYEDLASQPFVERRAGFQWKVDFIAFEGGTSAFQAVRSLKVAERRRGQQAFEDKDTLEECRFGKDGIPGGAVAVINAFSSESDGAFHYALSQKGFVVVLVVEFGPAPAAAPATPKFVLADEIHFVTAHFDRRSPMLGGRGGSRGAPSTGRGSRGSGGASAAPSGRGNSGPDGAPIATQVTDREQMNIYQLQNIRAEALLVMLQEQFGRTARLTADTDRQRIIASTDTQAEADKITALIRKLDEAPAPGAAAGGGEAAANQEFVVVQLKHVRSESLFQIIKQLLPPSARLIEDSDQQRLIVQGTPADLKTVTEAIARLDTPPENAFPGKAATARNASDPNALDPTRTQRDPSSFLQQLQQQYLYGHLPPQQDSPASGDLARQYQSAEQEAQALAQQWRTLTTRPQGDVKTTADIAAAKSKLHAAVAKAFEARQKQQQAELLEMQRRIYGLANTIEDREKLKDQIIDRRVQDLLNPALQWNPPSAANPPSAFNPLNAPRNPATGSPFGQSAPAKGTPVSGPIVQLQGDLVHVSIGPEDDIQPGQVLHVFRGDEYVAELEVRGMQNDHAVARVKRKQSALRPDDRVFTEQPAQPAADPTASRVGSAAPAGRPLSDAVREFNAANHDTPLVKDQPLLTDDEVVAAIRWKAMDPKEWGVSDGDLQTLLAIAEWRLLPSHVKLKGGHSLVGESSVYAQQTIGFEIQHPDNSKAIHIFREQFGRRPPRRDETYTREFTPASNEPTATPLLAAIHGFNERYKNHPLGKDQPALTMDEVYAAIRWWTTQRNKLPVTNEEFRELEKISETGQLPAKAEFEVLTSFQPNDELLFDAWSVRIRMPHGKDGGTYAYTIRDRWLRVKKLNERKIAWGPVSKSGLQVGVWIDPPGEVFAKGQQFVPHFYFRNAGDKEQSISLPRIMTHSYYETLHITDDSGRNLQFDRDEGPGGPVGWTQLPFPPGAEHEVTGLPVAVGMVKRAPGVETVLCAEPGQQCRLKFSLDDYLSKDDPKGPLETGELRFAAAKE